MEVFQTNPFEVLDSKLLRIERLLLEIKNGQSTTSPPKSNHGDDVVNIKEAAMLLNLAIPTIYGLVSRRILISYKRGKKLYFKRSELLAWIQTGKRSSLTEIQAKAKTFNAHTK